MHLHLLEKEKNGKNDCCKNMAITIRKPRGLSSWFFLTQLIVLVCISGYFNSLFSL